MTETDRTGGRRGGRPGFLGWPALAVLLVSAACASNGPRMGGLSIGGTHFLKVGDVVELTLPVAADGTRAWRVSSYDSLYLSIAERPQVVQGKDGKPVLRIKARAKTPGKTTVEVTEVAPPRGQVPRVESFKVNISM